jgi:hypothetical protein
MHAIYIDHKIAVERSSMFIPAIRQIGPKTQVFILVNDAKDRMKLPKNPKLNDNPINQCPKYCC